MPLFFRALDTSRSHLHPSQRLVYTMADALQQALERRRTSVLARPKSTPLAHPDKSVPPSSPLVNNVDTTRVGEGSLTPPRTDGVQPVDLMVNLKRAEPSVVKTRSGSVLSRGFILKTDYYPSGSW